MYFYCFDFIGVRLCERSVSVCCGEPLYLSFVIQHASFCKLTTHQMRYPHLESSVFCTCAYAFVCWRVCGCACVGRPEIDIRTFHNCSPFLLLRQGLLLSQSARLVSQLVLKVPCPCLPGATLTAVTPLARPLSRHR